MSNSIKKASVRSKIDNFFQSGNKSNQSAQKYGKDLEDPVDVYNHTKQFYKSTNAAKDYDAEVEVGERKIKGDPSMMMSELDQLVYGGKKVNRADLGNESM